MSVKRKGFLVVLEGPEGAGKTTNREFMREWFLAAGFNVVITREPGGTPFAEKIRELLLKPTDETVDPLTEMLLFFAARRQHVIEVIQPALDRGDIVICDRFVDSTYAYQVHGRRFEDRIVQTLETLCLNGLRPDITFLFDISVTAGAARAASRGRLDRFEMEGFDFFERVAEGYRARMALDPGRYRRIDAGQNLPAVQAQLVPLLMEIQNELRRSLPRPAYNVDAE